MCLLIIARFGVRRNKWVILPMPAGLLSGTMVSGRQGSQRAIPKRLDLRNADVL